MTFDARVLTLLAVLALELLAFRAWWIRGEWRR